MSNDSLDVAVDAQGVTFNTAATFAQSEASSWSSTEQLSLSHCPGRRRTARLEPVHNGSRVSFDSAKVAIDGVVGTWHFDPGASRCVDGIR